ncbi:hypothetical protein LX36DRAFT_662417 [Colletotrichum falcatum]|nr:hypothetical protein LX36DRAFT_662417 [Colletotrichum falcatum]
MAPLLKFCSVLSSVHLLKSMKVELQLSNVRKPVTPSIAMNLSVILISVFVAILDNDCGGM